VKGQKRTTECAQRGKRGGGKKITIIIALDAKEKHQALLFEVSLAATAWVVNKGEVTPTR